jgi:uncharacterized membrane protein (UPF0127 family)
MNTPELRARGLSNLQEMPKGAGALLVFDEPEDVPITMAEMNFPLDLVFINEGKVHTIRTAQPGEESIVTGKPSDMVLEINAGEGNGIKAGNDASLIGVKEKGGQIKYVPGDIEPEPGKLHLLDDEGKVQMNLRGNERVFSRKDTKRIVALSEAATASEDDKDYKKLGRYFVKVINRQDSQEPEYVEE